jgi:hypothetical protein
MAPVLGTDGPDLGWVINGYPPESTSGQRRTRNVRNGSHIDTTYSASNTLGGEMPCIRPGGTTDA